ncbi:uncharacterized protein ATNIH1004_002048 [Aspergillus tanneri]|uniref:Retrotransposon gag domain-containing protein n=1 Tax=Aspergillus tanneri TaxID=1220188 RepID=A0A5M9M3I7_9EURO|nr:uncharacterized protein ATNIH1004_002048 [Aspergillus tanneri]KAA8641308.1 hypothetical protein ATNIH1004_002048 [Aspergillus tanneri]
MAPRRVQRAGSQVTRNTENSVNPVSENTASIQAQPDASMNPGPAEETVEETAVLQGDSPRKGATGSTTTNDSSSDNEFAELRTRYANKSRNSRDYAWKIKRRALQELIDYEKRIQENRKTAPQPMPEPTHALKPPAPPAHVSEYMGKNMQEYQTFIARMETHFERNRYYFTNDTTKVVEGTAHLCATFIRLWRQHEEEVADKPTWEDFRKFLLRQLNDPVNLRRDASQRYHDARQQDHQNVREFAAYLNQWEVQPQKHTQKINERITSGQESSKTCDMKRLNTPTNQRHMKAISPTSKQLKIPYRVDARKYRKRRIEKPTQLSYATPDDDPRQHGKTTTFQSTGPRQAMERQQSRL